MIREAAWLDAELSRVVGRERSYSRPTTPLELSMTTRVPLANIASASANVSGMSSPYGYTSGVQGGPALTNEDVRRLEHPEEFVQRDTTPRL